MILPLRTPFTWRRHRAIWRKATTIPVVRARTCAARAPARVRGHEAVRSLSRSVRCSGQSPALCESDARKRPARPPCVPRAAWEYCCHKDHHAQGILDPSKTYEIWFGVRFETATTEIREDMPSTFITVAGSTDVWCTHDVFKINDLAPGHNKICKYRVVPPRGLAESWVIAQSPNNDAYDYRGYWRAYGQIYEVKIGPQGGPYTYNVCAAPRARPSEL